MPADMSYLALKAAHFLGIVVFVGNVIVSGVWKTFADRTGDARVIAYACRLLKRTDLLFTGPGAALVLMTGLLMARSYGAFWRVPWLLGGIVIFAVSGLIWLVVLVPIQLRQERLVRDLGSGPVPVAYRRLARAWMVWGSIAMLLPLVNVYVMLFKPGT